LPSQKRRDRVHHLIALGFDPCRREQDTDAEVEAVEDHDITMANPSKTPQTTAR